MSTTYYPIVGVHTGLGPGPEIPSRVEADVFFDDPKFLTQRHLLYLAMAHFQNMSHDEKTSYFQIAGIHGLPHLPWDAPGIYHKQYCEHHTIMFGSWHRPYLVLVEQRLHEIMFNDVIPKFKEEDQPALKEAASHFRLPYWDWAQQKKRAVKGQEKLVYDVPLIVKGATVKVPNRDGGMDEIPNPLNSFIAKGPMGEYGITSLQLSGSEQPYVAAPFDRARATSRNAADPTKDPKIFNDFVAKGLQNNGLVSENLMDPEWSWEGANPHIPKHLSLKQTVTRLLSKNYFPSIAEFTTTTFQDAKDAKLFLSLEAIHNNIHGFTGGDYGHMGHVPVAAFDPIFWLHHANVDRLLAIWQALNKDSWWTSFDVRDRAGKVIKTVTPQDDLAPFRRNEKGEFHTPNTSRDTTTFGYVYPETQSWKYDTEEEYEAAIRTALDALYGTAPAKNQLAIGHADIVINVAYPRFLFDGVPFSVVVLLEGQEVGRAENFSFVPGKAPDGTVACENCAVQQEADVILTNQIFLTHELVNAVPNGQKALNSLDKDAITNYLKEHLSWQVVMRTGLVIPRGDASIAAVDVYPIIGRRELVPVQEYVPGRSNAPVLDEALPPQPVTELLDISPEHLLDVKVHWNEDGTLKVHTDLDDLTKATTFALGNWSTYSRLF